MSEAFLYQLYMQALSSSFPQTVSYNRLVELEKKVAALVLIFVKQVLLGKCTGINFIDSPPLRVCRD